jgi:hypothetical protein
VCLYIRRAILHTRSAAKDRSDFFALQGWDINHNFVTLIYTQKSTLLFQDKKKVYLGTSYGALPPVELRVTVRQMASGGRSAEIMHSVNDVLYVKA